METLQTRMQAYLCEGAKGKEGCIRRVSHYGTVISVQRLSKRLPCESSKAERGIREDSRALDALLKRATVFLILI